MRRIACLLSGLLLASASPVTAIVGGSLVTSDSAYGFTAAVYAGSSPASGQFCGGTLVSSTVVVTAAHCTEELLHNLAADLPLDPFRTRDPAGIRLKVMVGSRTLGTTRGEHRYVAVVHEHPDADLDVTVLELESPVTTPPIDFLRPGSAAALDAAGVTATITGWGRTSEGGSGSSTLKVAQVPIVSDLECARAYSRQLEPDTMLCAGYPQGGTDTCQGDSGGPLVVPGPNGGWLLAGATSWGHGCARAGYPGVYAELRAAAAFIDGFLD